LQPSKILMICLQPFRISSSLMLSGGVMRTALDSNNNQKRINLFLAALRTNSLVIWVFFKIIASINPLPLISVISGCTKRERKSFSFSSVCAINLLSVISVKVAKQAAAITALPPKVVICPSFGLANLF